MNFEIQNVISNMRLMNMKWMKWPDKRTFTADGILFSVPWALEQSETWVYLRHFVILIYATLKKKLQKLIRFPGI